MPGEPFDAFARALAKTRSRRQMLRVAAGGLLGGVVAAFGLRSNADASLLCNPQITPCKQLFHGVCTPCTDLGKLCDPDGTCVYSCQGCTHPSQGNVSCLPGCGDGFCCNTIDHICQPANQRCVTANSSGQCVTCQQAGTTCNPDGTCAEVTCTGCTHLDPTTHLCVQGCATGNCCNGTACVATPRCSTTDNTGHCVTCAASGTCCKPDGTCAAAGGCQGADSNGNCAPCSSLSQSVGGQSISLCCDTAHGSVCVVPAETCACAACSSGTCKTCAQTSTQQSPTCCFNPNNAGGICVLQSQAPNGKCIGSDGACGCVAPTCCNAGTCVSSASQCPSPGCSFTSSDGRCECGCPSGQVCDAQSKQCGPPPCGASGQPCCANNTCNTGLTCQSGFCTTPGACGGANQPCCTGCGSSSIPNQCDDCNNNATVSLVCSNPASPSNGTCQPAKALGATCAASGNQTADGMCQGAWTVAGNHGLGSCNPTNSACTADSQCCTFCNPTTGTCTAGYCDKGSNTVGQCNHACGGAGQPCCPGSFCASGLTCQSNHQTPAAFFCLSTTCGGSGQPCCGGFGPGGVTGTCFGFGCQNGTCP